MRRRDFIALIGGGVALAPAESAQQSAMALVGLLSGTQLDDRLMAAVRQGLKDAGYIEGRNVAIKHRSADGRFDRLPTLAAELVADPVAVIVALPSPRAALAAKAASPTTTFVFVTGPDPVEHRLVTSLNRPGGNVSLILVVGTLALPWSESMAQDYPSRAVHMIVPLGAGGPTDLVARLLADGLSN